MSAHLSLEEALRLVDALPPEQRQDLENSILASPVSLWNPNPGPQEQAYNSAADELFYGGAAGGGKSALVIGLALTQHQRSLILRRESTQLRGMVDDIARTIKTRDGLNKQDGQWRLPPTVSQRTGIADQLIEFGGVPNPGDEERHQGIPHDLLAFDEVTQLPEYIIDYLSTWCRTTNPDQRTRIVLTSNPPTPSTQYNQRSASGQWIIRRYAPWLDPQYRDPYGYGPAKPGELRWFVTLDGKDREWPDPLPFHHNGEVIRPKSRTFIPARVTDNPFLAQSDYESQLQKLPEPLRSAMLYGDFSISLSDKPLQVFPTEWVRATVQRYNELTAPTSQNSPQTALGVDVARGGADSTVVVPRHLNVYHPPIVIPTTRARTGPEVAAEVLKLRRDQATLVIDANGVGASVYDHLTSNTNLTPNQDVVAYVGSSRSTRKDRSRKFGFVNRRSEAYWMLREALDPASTYKVALPPDDELLQELYVLSWVEQSGNIKVTPKEDVIKALGRSPDKADALVLAHTVRDETSEALLDARSAREERLMEARSPRAYEALQTRLSGSRGYRRARWSDRADQLPYPEHW